LRQHAFEIPHQRQLDLAVRIFAPDQSLVLDAREFLDVIEMIEEMLYGRM
jgi:hypothetical protein